VAYEYLVLKLSKAGMDKESILKMLREQLMAAWTELVAADKDKPAAAVGTKIVGPFAAPVHYDPEFERKRPAVKPINEWTYARSSTTNLRQNWSGAEVCVRFHLC